MQIKSFSSSYKTPTRVRVYQRSTIVQSRHPLVCYMTRKTFKFVCYITYTFTYNIFDLQTGKHYCFLDFFCRNSFLNFVKKPSILFFLKTITAKYKGTHSAASLLHGLRYKMSRRDRISD